VPFVVGMRARTSQRTIGRASTSVVFEDVLFDADVSTGTLRGARSRDGVTVPGVAGGVKAGDMSDGRDD
jgi:hypothetical protein